MKWFKRSQWYWFKNFREFAKQNSIIKIKNLLLLLPLIFFYFFNYQNLKILSISIFLFFSLLLLLNNWKNIFLILLICLIYFLFIHQRSLKLIEGNYEIEGTIYKNEEKYFLINYENFNILVFKNSHISYGSIENGNYVYGKGELVKLNKANFPQNWLLENNIKYQLKNVNVNLSVRNKFNLFQELNLNEDKDYIFFNKYWFRLILGSKNDVKLNQIVSELGINHLLIASGFHIELIFLFSSLIKTRNEKNRKIINLILIFLIFNYAIFSNSPVSILKALFFKIFNDLNKKHKWKLSYIDILILTMFSLFLINKFWIFSLSFIFSFFNTFLVIYLNEKIICKKIKIKKYLFISFLIYLSNLFITTQLTQKINLITPLWIILLTPVVEIVYIFSFFFWWSKPFLNFIYYLFDNLLWILWKSSLLIKINFKIDFHLSYYWILFIILFYFSVFNFRKIKKIRILRI
ncbi:hypothetical protein MCSF7_00331 [Mycoplasmopsis columbina SF7]|uniref:ComEC/Rec2-related protein domain-containing protein n=1 Tax=Mycoplasmopsis columbina SF7 TaxID=1037410 RepID=F9UJM0_9BACT|nr:hypothetical protein MCSF7_00331 [Mycoplasmopsis columbina SF7]